LSTPVRQTPGALARPYRLKGEQYYWLIPPPAMP
jgi:hypothetical protein